MVERVKHRSKGEAPKGSPLRGGSRQRPAHRSSAKLQNDSEFARLKAEENAAFDQRAQDEADEMERQRAALKARLSSRNG